ncbi:MAG TPA: lipopolysaccharide heptosyltransferase II [Thermoanaerobaculia bacterium]|nr:lipopolysaccharide heptosyltransferase II [Thermoanaerobaculia bacterium]
MSTNAARLVIAPNWIGDAVMSLPLVRALKRNAPERRVSILARPGPAAIYRAEGSADEVLDASGLLASARAASRGRFGEAWLLPNSFRSALVAFLAGIPERIGFASDGRAPLLTAGLAPPPRTSHQLRDYDSLLVSRGVQPDLAPPRLAVPAASVDAAAFALARAGLPPNRPLVLLAPGAAFGWTKRWPAERFGQLGRLLLERGLLCAVVIGPGEEPLAEEARVAAGGYLPALGADLDPMGVAALAARARAVVSNDSGPMHLAAAVGTPVVAFFGPTDPGRTGPTGVPSEVLDRYVFCSPCYRKECPYRHECMREIGVEDVLAAVMRLSAAGAPGATT